MRKRLVSAALCILILPLLFSLPQNGKPTNSVPFASVALAGRTIGGIWCQCGCYACFCDPDEEATMCLQSNRTVSDKPGSVNQGAGPSIAESPLGFDFGSGALLFVLAFFVWTRLRGPSL